MAQINANISGETSPLAIVVRKVGEETGNRCIGACNSFPVNFTEDDGSGDYYFIVTDSSGCIVDSRNIVGGVHNINCDPSPPDFDAILIQPTCKEDGTYNPGILRLTNVENISRYKICYNTVSFNCSSCSDSDGFILNESIDITLNTPNIATSTGVLIRAYKDSSCTAYKEFFATMITSVCQGQEIPEFSAEIIQPYCSSETGGTPQNATIKISGAKNATRYKICYNQPFNCDCNTSDGSIIGENVEISIIPPSEGVSQNLTLRVINGSGCTNYKDFFFNIRSPKCSQNELTLMNLDLQMFFGDSGNICNQPNTYDVAYDFHLIPNTPGMLENGTQIKTGVSSQRTLPTGNDVPNVYVAASYKMLCGNPGNAGNPISNGFHRFTWNMSYLKAKYPTINEFIFDVYATKTKDTYNTTTTNTLRPRINAFTNIAMTREYYSNDAHDAFRIPSEYKGISCNSQDCATNPLIGNTKATIPDIKSPFFIINQVRKIGTIRFNYTTNRATWTGI